MSLFRVILILFLFYFFWRFIKIISRMLGGRMNPPVGSAPQKEKFSDIEEAKFEDITPKNKNGEPEDTEIHKN
jgi:hypothetical protein